MGPRAKKVEPWWIGPLRDPKFWLLAGGLLGQAVFYLVKMDMRLKAIESTMGRIETRLEPVEDDLGRRYGPQPEEPKR